MRHFVVVVAAAAAVVVMVCVRCPLLWSPVNCRGEREAAVEGKRKIKERVSTNKHD